MTVGIHQSQYIPWIPYFSKIRQSDVFVLLDDVQFQKNGLQNRNYILSANGQVRLTLSVKVHLGDAINRVILFNSSECTKHLKSIEQSYRKAPYFADVFPLIAEPLQLKTDLLVDIAHAFIQNTVRFLDLKTKIVCSSHVEKEGQNSDLVLSLCKNLGASTYLSGSGGAAYLKEQDFVNSGIGIRYQTYNFAPYKQFNNKTEFVPQLSVLDVLFNEGKNALNFI